MRNSGVFSYIVAIAFTVPLLFRPTSSYSQPNYASPYAFTTFAGSGPASGSKDGSGIGARFYQPFGVARDGYGNLYVADSYNQTIRKITPAGVVTTLAGTPGSVGSSDGVGSGARFAYPEGIAVNVSGEVYVADTNNYIVRKITKDGIVTTFAGSAGVHGSDNGSGSEARFGGVRGIAVDLWGNVYVADNCTIRKITPAGVVTTLAGSAGDQGSTDGAGADARFVTPVGVAVDGLGNVYVADTASSTIRKIDVVGIVTTLAGSYSNSGLVDGIGSGARFSNPRGLTVNGDGTIFVADTGNNTVRKITPAGVVTTLSGHAPFSGWADGVGEAARFGFPCGVAADDSGNLYVTDTGNNTIRTITSNGVVTTFAGTATGGGGSTDGTGATAQFGKPSGMAIDRMGNLYVADTQYNVIRKITSAGAVTTLAGTAGVEGWSDGVGSDARFSGPQGVAVDPAGNIYVADTLSSTIRKITPAGLVTTLAGLHQNVGWADGNATAARFQYPHGIAVDSGGTVYVADTVNSIIRKISPAGTVTTFAGSVTAHGSADGAGTAARFYSPRGVAVDGAGNVYVADTFNNTIRMITASGVVTTVAGVAWDSPGSADGNGSSARFSSPVAVAVDMAGDIWVSDVNNRTIRKINPSADVTTIAGLVTSSSDWIDGVGMGARFSLPWGIAVSESGTVYVADSNNHTIRAGVIPVAPAITTHPANRTVVVNSAVALTASASGIPEPTLQWRKDGSELPGATNGTYAISSAQLTDTGTYIAVATNYSGSVTSHTATLTVVSTPNPLLLPLYRMILMREITVGEVQSDDAMLADGMTLPQLYEQLLTTSEYQKRRIESVIRLYYAGLARPPDFDGLMGWSSVLRSGQATLAQVAQAFVGSAEFQGRYGSLDDTQFIRQLYQNILRRQADSAGLTYWLGQIAEGASRGVVLAGFSESAEFQQSIAQEVTIERAFALLWSRMPTWTELISWTEFLQGQDQTSTFLDSPEFAGLQPGGLNHASFVGLGYQGFLRRPVDAGGQSFWAGRLSTGQTTRPGLIYNLIGSGEYGQTVAPVFRFYVGSLGRLPEAAGLDGWVGYLRDGHSLDEMAQGFATASEFQARTGGLDNSGFIQQLYRDVLGREADPEGLAGWTTILNSDQATRSNLLLEFVQSAEAQERFAPDARTYLHYIGLLQRYPSTGELSVWRTYLTGLDYQFIQTMLDLGTY
jgi:sugar lactone lactonase YvrE